MKRTKKNKKLYLINFIKKIKWVNLLVLLIYIYTSMILIHDFYYIIIKFASYTYYGAITGTLALIINISALEYIQERI